MSKGVPFALSRRPRKGPPPARAHHVSEGSSVEADVVVTPDPVVAEVVATPDPVVTEVATPDPVAGVKSEDTDTSVPGDPGAADATNSTGSEGALGEPSTEMSRAELNAMAEAVGIEHPDKFPNKQAVVDAIDKVIHPN